MKDDKNKMNRYVAPFMGAWIEIFPDSIDFGSYSVAPFMGAWIEIVCVKDYVGRIVSRSLHGSVD